MIDLHCHILPGLDDGSASADESSMMAWMAAEHGTEIIAATPHANLEGTVLTAETVRKTVAVMQKGWQQRDLEIRLLTGMEVLGRPNVPKLLEKEQLLTLNGTQYLLIEFYFEETPRYMTMLLEDIFSLGVVPVIAHPERYYAVQDDPFIVTEWFERGWLLQLNKGSLLGSWGERVNDAACWLLDNGLAHLIASDAHSPYQRTPDLSGVRHWVNDYFNPEQGQILLEDNPRRIITGQQIVVL